MNKHGTVKQLSKWVMHVRRAGWPGGPVAMRLGIAVALLGLLAWLYLAQASQMSTIGRHLEAMRAEYDQLKRENAELLNQITQEGSIPHLQQRSAELGLIPAEQVDYLLLTTMPLPTTGEIVPVVRATPGAR
jgi:hypothetical protein